MERICKCGCGGIVTSTRKKTVYIHGHNKSNLGRTFSEEARLNMSKAHKGKKLPPRTQEHSKKLSEVRKGKKLSPESIAKRTATRRANGNYIHSEEWKKKMSALMTGRKMPPEHGQKIKQAWLDGKMVCNVPNNWSTPVKYRGIQMRSKLEGNFAKYLDEEKVEWIYEPQRFDLGDCTYLPDFYLSKFDHYIETKGAPQGLEKVEKFRKMGYKITVITNDFSIWKEDID